MEPFLPMLAVKAEPFDSPEYLFEVKWDGVRALAARDAGGWRLWGRDRADYRARYPELDVLAGLPAGTVLDGELVLWAGDLPDRDALLARHPRMSGRAVSALSRQQAVTYVVFDAPYDRGRCLFGQPLTDRRALARECVERLADPRLVFSEAVVGSGKAFFAEVVARGQEGVLAKHQASRYLPGRRSAAWKKIKPCGCLPAVIIGYLPGRQGVRGLFVATLRDGALRYVAHLRSGLSAVVRRQLAERLAARVRSWPAVPCPERGVWVEPELYCRVRFLAWTRRGRLLGASFHGLLDPASGTTLGRAGAAP
jgi:ATP-dependent DNA ligase